MPTIGFLGTGMMASALIDGILSAKLYPPSSIHCSDIYPPARQAASSKGCTVHETNDGVVTNASDAIVICVKPNCVDGACADIRASMETGEGQPLVISIAAGVTLDSLQTLLPSQRIVRVMPNTPCLVNSAASAFALGEFATEADCTLVSKLFNAVGLAIQVPESQLDAVTGLSGSGPAFVFQFIEALSDGGVRVGLPRNVATRLAAQTVKGAAEMVLMTEKHPGVLKDGVTSPGGTTIAGVEALERGGFRASTISAVTAATRRSMQLGGKSEDEIRNKNGL
jgi:pyrroline-5-carboxylate reductase